jgi:hypothetical protein
MSVILMLSRDLKDKEASFHLFLWPLILENQIWPPPCALWCFSTGARLVMLIGEMGTNQTSFLLLQRFASMTLDCLFFLKLKGNPRHLKKVELSS